MRVAIIGGVRSTEVALRALVRNGFEVCAIIGYEPTDEASVSGYVNMREVAQSLGLMSHYVGFRKVSDPQVDAALMELKVQYLFVVGLSQLLPAKTMRLASMGVIGFHPTRLPQGRGRSPIGWLIDLGLDGAATFFELGVGADEGGILVQEPFEIGASDHALEVYERLYVAMDVALQAWLPRLREGEWQPQPQDAERVSFFGLRRPDDGRIAWDQPLDAVDRRIRAASFPHPGAYTFHESIRLPVTRSAGRRRVLTHAFPGTVMERLGDGWFGVQVQDGLIECRIESPGNLRVGARLGG